MFLVTNISKIDVVLTDLRVSISTKQSVDLDKICPRSRSEISNPLIQAIQKQLLRITHKDSIVGGHKDDEKEKALQLEKQIHDAVTRKLNERPHPNQQTNNQEISELSQKVDSLIELMLKNPNAIAMPTVKNTNDSNNSNVNVDVSDDKLRDIHARTVKQLTKGVEGRIDSETKTKKSTIAENANELEGLL